ncbi:MAG: aldo/keto reductase [Anaerolineales bacterium]|jgi:aryl-alcohol dehydrogenase-like predicted oxidoreductase
METRKLGKSDLKVSAFGLGCWAIGGPWWVLDGEERYPAGWGDVDDRESIRAIHAGLDAGINFLDTAANYGTGHSETIVGKALAGKRDQVVIATKFGHIINETDKTMYGDDDQILANVRRDCENSLRRLNTDYIDIYQLHEARYDPEKAPAVMEELEKLVDEGKIRWYGWSTDLVDRAAIFAEGEHCTSIQFALNVAHDNPEMRALCAEKNLVGINKSPFSRGILTGRFAPENEFPENDHRSRFNRTEGVVAERLAALEAVRDVLTANGHTVPQAALAYIWALDGNMVPIPGFRTVAQVEENAKALSLGPLSESQVAEVQQILAELDSNYESNV